MAISTAAAIIGGSVVSGVLGARSQRKASQAQQAGVDTATGEQRRQFDVTTEQLRQADLFNRQQINKGRLGSIRALAAGGRRQREQLEPFAQAGVGALQQQQALLGLGTPEQQAAARASLTESAGQKFIRERAERSLLRNQAAIGGIGGGNVRSALVQQGAGFAAQIEADQFRRLSQLATGGQAAATNIGQGALTTGANVGQTQFQAGQLTGAGAINTAARQGQFGQTAASNIGNLAVAGGQARATGITGQNTALQQGIGGVFTGAAQGGFFTPPPNQFTLPAANVDPFGRAA
jgi:hypothetical protein